MHSPRDARLGYPARGQATFRRWHTSDQRQQQLCPGARRRIAPGGEYPGSTRRSATAQPEGLDDGTGWARPGVEQHPHEQVPQQSAALRRTPGALRGEPGTEHRVAGCLTGERGEHRDGVLVGCRQRPAHRQGRAPRSEPVVATARTDVGSGIDPDSDLAWWYPALGKELSDLGFRERGQQQVLGPNSTRPEPLSFVGRPQQPGPRCGHDPIRTGRRALASGGRRPTACRAHPTFNWADAFPGAVLRVASASVSSPAPGAGRTEEPTDTPSVVDQGAVEAAQQGPVAAAATRCRPGRCRTSYQPTTRKASRPSTRRCRRRPGRHPELDAPSLQIRREGADRARGDRGATTSTPPARTPSRQRASSEHPRRGR